MLHFDSIDVLEGTDVNKTSLSKECNICQYWYFLNYSFKFHPNDCNGCQDLLLISMKSSEIVILSTKGSYYYCIISLISKNEVMNLMHFPDQKKRGIVIHKNLLSHIYVGEGTW